MFNVDDSVSLRRCGSSWNHHHDPSSTQPPHLQAFLLHPYFCGQSTWDPPSSPTSKCTDGATVWRHHSGSLELHHPAWLGGLVGWHSFRPYTWRHLSPAVACRALGPHVGCRLLSHLRSLLWCGRCLLCLTRLVTQLGALPPSCSDLRCCWLVAKSCLTLSPPHEL